MDRPRIVVLDDESIVRRELTRGLEKEGYDTEIFSDGESALARLKES